uniref:Uncharacterized protein n=1 Tax=Nicotiana tabacum TaxID=4097 RepID=A0A1S4DJX2_TOBAC|nr:PREDICTED: uncharacterized protein LOC107830597 [Nicotiana tabacum]
MIDQLRAEMNELKASAETPRRKMDLLASKKEDIKEELASLNEELRPQLDSAILEWDDLGREYTALKSKLEATLIDYSEVEERLAKYKTDVEIVEACLRTKAEYVKRLSQRETLEEIHAQRFDLLAKIEEAKRIEVETKELYEPEGPEGSGAELSSGEDWAEKP